MISTAFWTVISLNRPDSRFIFLWLCCHTSTRRMVSSTGWGKVFICFWSSLYISTDSVYACRSTSQCWHVTPCQNTGGAWRGQFFVWIWSFHLSGASTCKFSCWNCSCNFSYSPDQGWDQATHPPIEALFTRVRTNFCMDEFCSWTACLHGSVQVLCCSGVYTDMCKV